MNQTKKPLVEGGTKKSNGHDDVHDHSLIVEDVHKQIDNDWSNKNTTKPLKGFGSSFPKGLSDILIIFQKVGPKTKTHSIMSSSSHTCGKLSSF